MLCAYDREITIGVENNHAQAMELELNPSDQS